MKRWLAGSAAAVLAVSATLGIRVMSHLPYTAESEPRAVVRLSWRVLGRQIRECRRLSPEELQELPAHMRREEVCEGRVAPYMLNVLVDGALADSGLVRASGARQDRPIYVFRELSVEPGEHRLEISFVSQGPTAREPVDSAGPRPLPANTAGTVRTADAAPEQLRLDARLRLEPREIALVVYDSERRELVLQERSSR